MGRVLATCAIALAAVVAGCQLVVGLDRYADCTPALCTEGGPSSDAPPDVSIGGPCSVSTDCAAETNKPVCSNKRCVGVSKLVHGIALHLCVQLADGAIWCWGNNDFGQLGQKTQGPFAKPGPITVIDTVTDPVLEMGVGLSYSCARTLAGKVWCWGGAGAGSGSITFAKEMTKGLAASASKLSVGGNAACMRLTNGDVYCWGENNASSIGCEDGGHARVDVPRLLASGTDDVGTGLYNTCVLMGLTIRCFGNDFFGGLGDGTAANQDVYCGTNDFMIPATITSLDPSEFFMCARDNNSGRWCWGSNRSSGYLWTPWNTSNEPTAKRLDIPELLTAFSPGWRHSCSLDQAGVVKCWGYELNGYGELGKGTVGAIVKPTVIDGLTAPIVDVAAYRELSCALEASGRVMCWGDNRQGAIDWSARDGAGDSDPHPTPKAVVFP